MELFQSVGNHDIEGVTVINACYGGTAALLNALSWADSSGWDGRYAIVIAADIAIYAPGPARPTCGCGAVAMLIGRDAPLVIDLKSRTTHASHQWDFFKPNPHSEYPVVNGKFSQKCYLTAFDSCYTRFVEKQKKFHGDDNIGSNTIDFLLFHSPYNKLVQKTVQRLYYLDFLSGHIPSCPELESFKTIPPELTYTDRNLENILKDLDDELYRTKVEPSCKISKEVGNTYTAAVYLNLANLISLHGLNLIDKKITLFSYGSGAMASMLQIIPRHTTSPSSPFNLENIQRILNVPERLNSRGEPYTPAQFEEALASRERSHGVAPFVPTFPVQFVPRGTYYLKEITKDYERNYQRRPLDDPLEDNRQI